MRLLLFVVLGMFAIVALVGLRLSRMQPAAAPADLDHLVLQIPPGVSYGGGYAGRFLDISPDGQMIAFTGSKGRQGQMILKQRLAGGEPEPIAGTRNGSDPAFSPDGRWIAFYASGAVRIVGIETTDSTTFEKTLPPRGISWLDSDTLVLGNTQGGLLRASRQSGEIEPLVDVMGPQLPHLSPNVLPGGKAVVFALTDRSLIDNHTAVLDLETGAERWLMDENAFAPRYVSAGFLLFVQGFDRRLMAAPFDLQSLTVSGTAQSVLAMDLAGRGSGGSTDYAISNTGTLVYAPQYEENVDDVLAAVANLSLSELHVESNWIEGLRAKAR